MKIALITGFVDSKFLYREELYYNRLNSSFEIYLFSSIYSPPQKYNSILTDKVGPNHIRIKALIKFKDIVILNLYSKLKKFSPDIIHLFDAQQLVGLIPFIYAILNKKKLIYEHELKEYPINFLGKLRFWLLTKPLIKLYCKHASLIRVVTPAAQKILFEIHHDLKFIESKLFLTTLFYSEKIINSQNLSFGYKNSSRMITLCLSGKIDDLKFKRIVNFFSQLSVIKTAILFKFLIDFSENQIAILNQILTSKEIQFKHFGMVRKENFYDHLAICDGIVFVNPTISYFEAIGCNLPILVEDNDFSSHLESKNIFKFNKNSIHIDFINYIENVVKFNYSSDIKFSESYIIDELKAQYRSLYEYNLL